MIGGVWASRLGSAGEGVAILDVSQEAVEVINVEWLSIVPGPGRLLFDELSPREAALMAEYLGHKVASACRYLNAQQPDVVDFLARVPQHDSTGRRQVIAPAVGETLTVET